MVALVVPAGCLLAALAGLEQLATTSWELSVPALEAASDLAFSLAVMSGLVLLIAGPSLLCLGHVTAPLTRDSDPYFGSGTSQRAIVRISAHRTLRRRGPPPYGLLTA